MTIKPHERRLTHGFLPPSPQPFPKSRQVRTRTGLSRMPTPMIVRTEVVAAEFSSRVSPPRSAVYEIRQRLRVRLRREAHNRLEHAEIIHQSGSSATKVTSGTRCGITTYRIRSHRFAPSDHRGLSSVS